MEGDIKNTNQLKDHIEDLITRNKYFEARRELSIYSYIPLNPDLLLLKIKSLKDTKETIIEEILNLLIQMEESPKTFCKMFEHYSKNKMKKETYFYKNKLFASFKGSVEDYCAHGDGYMILGDKEKARGEYQKALELDPVFIKALESLMDTFTLNEEKPDRISYAQKILDKCPYHHNALKTMIDYFVHDNQVQEALDKIDVIKRECNPAKYVLYLEGYCYFLKEDYLTARSIFFKIRTGKCITFKLDLNIGLSYLRERMYKKVDPPKRGNND